MNEALAYYDLFKSENTVLKSLLKNKESLFQAKTDSLNSTYKKELKKQVRKKNINKIGIVAGFLLALLIK